MLKASAHVPTVMLALDHHERIHQGVERIIEPKQMIDDTSENCLY